MKPLPHRYTVLASATEESTVCETVGIVDRADSVMRFTGADLQLRLVIPFSKDQERAQRLLTKAEQGCLITNSLKFTPTLRIEIAVEQAA